MLAAGFRNCGGRGLSVAFPCPSDVPRTRDVPRNCRSPMKVRTCLIFACMIVVPGLALFSHQLPAGFRDAARTRIWEPIEAWATSVASSDDLGTEAATLDVTLPGPGNCAPPAEPVSMACESPTAPASFQNAPRSSSAVALASLGASTIDCRPFEAVAGTHVASCRVAIDAAGQLQRVFQAAGRNPDEAMDALLDTVRAWKERQASGAAMPRL